MIKTPHTWLVLVLSYVDPPNCRVTKSPLKRYWFRGEGSWKDSTANINLPSPTSRLLQFLWPPSFLAVLGIVPGIALKQPAERIAGLRRCQGSPHMSSKCNRSQNCPCKSPTTCLSRQSQVVPFGGNRSVGKPRMLAGASGENRCTLYATSTMEYNGVCVCVHVVWSYLCMFFYLIQIGAIPASFRNFMTFERN